MNNVGSVFVMRRGRSRVVVGMNGWLVSVKRSYPFLFYLDAAACIGGVFSLSTSNPVNSIPYVHLALPSHSPPFTSYLHPSSNASSKTHSRFHCPHWHMEEEHPHTPSSTLSISGLWNRHQPPSPEEELVRHDGPISLRVEVVLQ